MRNIDLRLKGDREFLANSLGNARSSDVWRIMYRNGLWLADYLSGLNWAWLKSVQGVDEVTATVSVETFSHCAFASALGLQTGVLYRISLPTPLGREEMVVKFTENGWGLHRNTNSGNEVIVNQGPCPEGGLTREDFQLSILNETFRAYIGGLSLQLYNLSVSASKMVNP